jgi:hypothetical protein
MDKIYPLLPWLTIEQAVDWIRRLTDSPISKSDLISLCEANQCAMYIDAGHSCSGTDEDTWLYNVLGSGYQLVRNPKALIQHTETEYILIELFGEVAWGDDDVNRTEDIKWFSTFDRSDVFPIFKSPSVKALAEKINADELADTERELQTLRLLSEQQRIEKEAALLRANAAEAEIGELRHELVLAADKADLYRSIALDVRGTEDSLVRQLKHERDARQSAELAAAEPRNASQESESDTVSKRERATYERLIYALAKEANYKLQQPFADEKLIINYARTLGAKVPEGKGVIAKKLESASARFSRDLVEYPADERSTADPIRELADPIRT